MRPLQNPTIPATLKKRMGFSEVTGARALGKTNPRALELKKSPSSLIRNYSKVS